MGRGVATPLAATIVLSENSDKIGESCDWSAVSGRNYGLF